MNLNLKKITVFGAAGVGKSAITVQFVQGLFVGSYDPTIEDIYRKAIEVNNQQLILEIVDTAGSEQFSVMRTLYMKNSHGFVIVYSITSRSTLDEAAGIYEQILREKDSDRVPAVLVANKCDLSDQRDVSRAEGEALAKSLSCKHIEASAKKRHNIDQIFYEVVLSILSMTIPQQRSQTQLKPEQPKKKHHKSKHCTLI